MIKQITLNYQWKAVKVKHITNGKYEEINLGSDVIDYEIFGHDVQIVDITLDPDESVLAEIGALNHMGDCIEYSTLLGDKTDQDAGLFTMLSSAIKRKLAGESFFVTHFKNKGRKRAKVAFTGPYPGSIVAVDLKKYGEELICQKGSFIAAAYGTRIGIHLNKKISTGFFSGQGFILQKIIGDGIAFIHGGGTVIEKQLENDSVKIEIGSLVAFTSGLKFDVDIVNTRNVIFGGEGLFLSKLTGTGSYWVAAMPFSRFADRILEIIPTPEKK